MADRQSPWLTKTETAQYVKRATSTLDRWIAEGYFPSGKYIKGRPYWNVREIDKWMIKRGGFDLAS